MDRSLKQFALDRAIRPACRQLSAYVCPVLLATLLTVGCTSTGVSLRGVPESPLSSRLNLQSDEGPSASPRTWQVLRVYDLDELMHSNPRAVLGRLQDIVNREPDPENVYAFAELAYLSALQAEGQGDEAAAFDLHTSALHAAYQYLFHPALADRRSPYDPQFRAACELYNGSLERTLRLQCKQGGLVIGGKKTIQTASGDCDVTIVLRADRWQPRDIARFEFVSDYEIRGLKNHYRTHGLGVPLIAVRNAYEGEPQRARYYPVEMSFPVTAFFRPLPARVDPQTGRRTCNAQGVLELYDPLDKTKIDVGGRQVALESDLTTPLAYFLSKPELQALATVGLLRPDELLKMRPDRPDPIMGLYMLEPYSPGKIPVVMVHGLWSSPMTWMEMFNDLRSSPEIRDNYQVWFYLYPTGQPFWNSAAALRDDLAEARRTLDPGQQDPALDQTVLVGHSMGGLVSRLQTIHSRDRFWELVSDRPLGSLRAEPEVKQKLAESFYFLPSPSIRRVITLGTPHHGSEFSNDTTQWLTERLVRLPEMLMERQRKLFRDNPDSFPTDTLLTVDNSVESLAPDCPAFEALLESEHPPWVKYHNVIGRRGKDAWLSSLAGDGDGVVTVDSARVDDVESELVVEADHTTVHAHPAAVLEVRRILLEHLAELRGHPSTASAEARAAEAVRDAGGVRTSIR